MLCDIDKTPIPSLAYFHDAVALRQGSVTTQSSNESQTPFVCVASVEFWDKYVGNNEVRAVGRHLNPKTLHFVVFGEAFNFESLAHLEFFYTPVESI